MYLFVANSGTFYLWTVGGAIALVVTFIFIMKGVMSKKQLQVVEGKKSRTADVRNYSALFISVGFFIALLTSFVIFERETAELEENEVVVFASDEFDLEDDILIKEEPPKPEPDEPVKEDVKQALVDPPVKETDDIVDPPIVNMDDLDPTKVDLDNKNPGHETKIIEKKTGEKKKKKKEDYNKVWSFVQEKAAFPGGQKALTKFVRKNLRYPKKAKKLKVQGKVYISFVVEKDGSMTNIKLMRGIKPNDAGCHEESLRVIQKMAESIKWDPAKNNGIEVRYKSRIPINFKLK